MADAGMKTILPPDIYDTMAPRIAGFRRGHGTVAFFEDQDALKALGEAQPPIAGMLPQWSEHASGMAQFIGEFGLSLLICLRDLCVLGEDVVFFRRGCDNNC